MTNKNRQAVLATMCAMGALTCAFAGEVSAREDSITLPTYAPGGYDKTPLFYTGRVYQGAQGRVYPYPMQDVLHDEKVDETYKYLTLENDWLQMGLLPEHGGHLNAYAKFAGDNSAMERAAKAREKVGELRKLLKEIEE